MKYPLLKLDRDFHKETLDLKEGSILEFLSCEYQKDYQQYFVVLKVIGNPIDKSPSIQVHYVNETGH